MRTLSSTLTAAQKAVGNVIWKIVLTSGVTSYTYSLTSTNILMKIDHIESPWSQTAKVLIRSQDNALAALSLEGFQGVISYGYNTSAGDEYSATAPLKVRGQELISSGGILDCLLDLYGSPDQMGGQEASTNLSLESGDTRTVKTLINEIMGATLAPYSHCTAITVTYDSEDSLIDVFKPADFFRIFTGDTRKEKVQELLAYTKCVGRFEDDGEFHIFSPTVSGTTYNYEYNDAVSNHTFFSKVYRNRLIRPSKITVKSGVGQSPAYTGSATDTASYAKIPDEQKFIQLRLASNAQATAIAEARIQRLQVDHQRGNGFAPMNVGQEVYDYVNITDSREADSRAGNIGYLVRTCNALSKPPRYDIGFGFGDVLLGGAIGIGETGSASQQRYVSYDDFSDALSRLYDNQFILLDRIKALEAYMMTDRVPKWHVDLLLQVPSAGV